MYKKIYQSQKISGCIILLVIKLIEFMGQEEYLGTKLNHTIGRPVHKNNNAIYINHLKIKQQLDP